MGDNVMNRGYPGRVPGTSPIYIGLQILGDCLEGF